MGYDRNPMNDVAAYAAEKERQRAEADAADGERLNRAADDVGVHREHGHRQPRSNRLVGRIRRAVRR